jgi:predicted DNA-binding ribbon-helix-helix protein
MHSYKGRSRWQAAAPFLMTPREWHETTDTDLIAMSTTTRPPASRSLKSQVLKRTIILNGRKTSISLEEAFWTSLKEIAATKNLRASILVEAISGKSETSNLSSAIRLYVLDFYQREYKKSSVRRSTKH